MKKALILALVVAGLAGLYFVNQRSVEIEPEPNGAQEEFRPNPSNATFLFDDGPITLSQGRNERKLSASSPIVEETILTEHAAYGDLNGDDRSDAAVLLARTGGSAGFFIYVAAFVSGPGAYKGTNAAYIGDRVNPTSISVEDGTITVSYLDREPDEAFAAVPTVPLSISFVYRNGELVEL